MTDYRKLFDLTGKTAVVLGAASGIGKSSAEALAGLGARVVCADRALDAAEATAAGIRDKGGWAEAAACDAASAADVNALAKTVMQKFPRLDIAVTTPGLNIRKTILDYTEEDLDRVLNLNIKGTVWFFQAFGRIMVEQKGGSIIACSSVRAVTIEPGLGVYGSTKAAIGAAGEGVCFRGRTLRRARQCDRAEHRRDRADRPVQAASRHLQSLRRPHRVQPLEQRRRGRDRRRLSRLGRRKLCQRQHAVRRRRLDRGGRAADRPHPAAQIGRLSSR
ncbi:short-subunit dehydrogenase involved in D-alanine esterification of teichoic acids [Bradyrhizobium sp. LB7.2]